VGRRVPLVRGPVLGRLTARALIALAAMAAAAIAGGLMVLTMVPETVPMRAPGPTAPVTPSGGGFIVLSELATPTPTLTRPPLPTATVLVPSATPTATLSPTETSTLTAVPTDTALPRPTSTPIVPTLTPTNPPPPPPPTPIAFPAPPLIAPATGSAFAENDTIELVWGSVGTLPANTYYVITLAYPHEGATWYDETPWTQDTRWVMSEHRYLLDLADGGNFWWTVQVRQRTGVGPDGRPTGVPLSPESETRTLTWRRSSGGGGGGSRPNTPEPPPP
jgi:hypothetical protein